MLHSSGTASGCRLSAICDSRFCPFQPKPKEAANEGGLKSRGGTPLVGRLELPKEMGVTAPATSMPISILARPAVAGTPPLLPALACCVRAARKAHAAPTQASQFPSREGPWPHRPH
jgi:hypothetical protein